MAHPEPDPAALAARHIGAMSAREWCLVDPPDVDAVATLGAAMELPPRVFVTSAAVHARLAAAGVPAELGAWPSCTAGAAAPSRHGGAPAGGRAAALVFWPKGKERGRLSVSMGAMLAGDGAPLWVVGPNRSGVESAPALCETAMVCDADAEVGRHSRLLCGMATQPGAAEAAGDPLASWEQWWRLDAGGATLRICSLPGVFSAGRLDDGTALLLDVLRATAAGGGPRVSDGRPTIDVGCGAGVIGAWCAAARGATVTLIDVDAVAVEATRRSLAANGLRGATVLGDGLACLDGPIDADIVCNPPFHEGHGTSYTFGRQLVEAAAARLRTGRSLTVVVNRFIDLLTPMRGLFGDATVLADDGRYRVLRATRGVDGAAR